MRRLPPPEDQEWLDAIFDLHSTPPSARPGTGAALRAIDDTHGNTDRLLIDPEGGTVVGERDVSPELDVETGERVTRELVDEVPADVLSRMTLQQCEVADGEVACQG